ncbi:MAG: membrane or secreted protein [Thermoanaerobaculia bacterium]|nr:membrane or secreted protein [Thermoanaerobaculia bacterium]
MIKAIVLAILLSTGTSAAGADLQGAWKTTDPNGITAMLIVTDDHFSTARYREEPAEFLYTSGGKWSKTSGDEIEVEFEFHTKDTDLVGTTSTHSYELSDGMLTIGDETWTRVDDGTPGALEGAWLITGNKRDGEIRTWTPGARRTMKILSGTRFHWIAYNVDTNEFFGTGGGTYTTENGRYTENIEFFSRDDSKAGRTLEFDYELVNGVWHHMGHSTKGDPMYELWTRRGDLGI